MKSSFSSSLVGTLGFVDRFNGTLIITGEVASVEAAMNGVIAKLCDYMGFAKPEITQS